MWYLSYDSGIYTSTQFMSTFTLLLIVYISNNSMLGLCVLTASFAWLAQLGVILGLSCLGFCVTGESELVVLNCSVVACLVVRRSDRIII